MEQEKIKPSDLRKMADELIAQGKMPSAKELLEAVADATQQAPAAPQR